MSNIDTKIIELTDADLEFVSATGEAGHNLGVLAGAAVGTVVGGIIGGSLGAAAVGAVASVAGGRIGGGLEDKAHN
jgi:outer membrane lipoprotein SlyB